jgi:hypothetical protein
MDTPKKGVIERITGLKPVAGLPPKEPGTSGGIAYPPSLPAEIEAGIKGDLDAELHRDAEIKRLANQPANLPNPEKAVGSKPEAPLKTFSVTISPILRAVTIETKEQVETVITQDGQEVKATFRF